MVSGESGIELRRTVLILPPLLAGHTALHLRLNNGKRCRILARLGFRHVAKPDDPTRTLLPRVLIQLTATDVLVNDAPVLGVTLKKVVGHLQRRGFWGHILKQESLAIRLTAQPSLVASFVES